MLEARNLTRESLEDVFSQLVEQQDPEAVAGAIVEVMKTR
jgi:hypothetical protein